MNKQSFSSSKQQIMEIFVGFILSMITLWVISIIGDTAKIPMTPCFYIGTTENLQPAKPCIDAVSWQTYQLLGFIFVAALTWGWYRLINKYMVVQKTPIKKKGKQSFSANKK